MSSRKRANDAIDELQNDAQKTKKSSEELMEITDLNDDCLVHIFSFLKFPNLLIIADTCNRFKEVIRTMHKCKQATKSVKINSLPKSITFNLKLLRNFGDQIRTLLINYFGIYNTKSEFSSQIMLAVEQYIYKYCLESKSLKELQLFYLPKDAFESIEKPFKSVEAVYFYYGFLGEKISQFNRYFPKMLSLEIGEISGAANTSCIETKLPFLQRLCVNTTENKRFFSTKNIEKAISLNSQLIIIYYNYSPDSLSFLNRSLPSLEKLVLDFMVGTSPFQKKAEKITFQKVKLLTAHISYGYYSQVWRVPIAFDELEELELHIHDRHSLNSLDWLKFAHPNDLKKLKINYQDKGTILNSALMMIEDHWPNLEEILFSTQSADIGFSADDLICLMNKLNHLKKVCLIQWCSHVIKSEELESKLSNEWKIQTQRKDFKYFITINKL